MEPPRRSRLPHAVPSWVQEGSFFFITICCTPRGTNQLTHGETGESLINSARFNHETLVWHCRLMLLMPDHLHAIIAFPQTNTMQGTITRWKRFLARNHGVRWQRDFFDHRLRNRHEETEKISYILMNPVRKGLCQRTEDWTWVFRPDDRPPPMLGD